MKTSSDTSVLGIIGVAYWIFCILQFFGIYAYFFIVQDWNFIVSLIPASFMFIIPGYGTIFAVLGAHEGCGWSWYISLLFFTWPFIMALIVKAIQKISNNYKKV